MCENKWKQKEESPYNQQTGKENFRDIFGDKWYVWFLPIADLKETGYEMFANDDITQTHPSLSLFYLFVVFFYISLCAKWLDLFFVCNMCCILIEISMDLLKYNSIQG